MEYQPLMLHQHFSSFSELMASNPKPTLKEFVEYLMENKSNLLEVAYFYQSITNSKSVPFLDISTVDLITHILTHVGPLP